MKTTQLVPTRPFFAGASLALLTLILGQPARPGAPPIHLVGTYDDQRLASIGSLTLPRAFLYDSQGTLVPRGHWPSGLHAFREHAGEAFCCVSDQPVAPGSPGPPEDCEVLYYGTEVFESFQGLRDSSGQPITYESLPEHRYLLVEFFASWCQPCVAGREELQSFFSSATRADELLWVTIDVTRLAEI